MTLRSDIHSAVDAVAPRAPHLSSTVMDAVLAAPPEANRIGRAAVPGLLAIGVLIVAVALVMIVGPGIVPGMPGHMVPPSTPRPGPAAVVITKWVSDPTVVDGPWPGYRPQVVYRGALTAARAERDPDGGIGWVVAFALDAKGSAAFAAATLDAATACGRAGCAERHVTTWLGLTQDDIDHWNERANSEYQAPPRGKLLADPVVVSPVTGGQGYIQGNFSQAVATELARRLAG